MQKDSEHHSHIHTPDSWARAVASLALEQAKASGSLKHGGPPVSTELQMTVQAATDCHRYCVIISGTKMCFCL